ncbi:G-type lectin S-receptor-like serine/threonine-protein kinase RKS1 isoform X2 [Manihot esculenta]|uniref:Receptor-like serine/threonine-protein kinase n=1 Tax=Manihot esculenta TaxID=3983 RepID=A0A2C9VLX7_MANES|nr:G-type lectin S-receptor-like serine/threonine-protein kinase RKS1 isoform X2 [Manihot esculenta]
MDSTMVAEKCFLIFFLLMIIHFALCASMDTIAINQTIEDGSLLISKENNFALGFFSPGNSKYRYLGIWYYKVREQTIVWVANRNHPINGSTGVLSVNHFGNLVLYSSGSQKVLVWSANVSREVTKTNTCCVAQLMDSGNLILVQQRSRRVVWESFDHPTDTLLPGMKLGLNRETGIHRFLTSWRSTDDPGTGDYVLELNLKGSPQGILYKGTKRYWRGVPWPVKSYINGRNFSFVDSQKETFVTYFPADVSVILRTKLDYSGLIIHLTWHETEGKWKELWSAPNKYQCQTYGHCGTYSKCNPSYLYRKFECDCLPGYEPQSPRAWNILKDGSGGCVRKRKESSSLCNQGEGFVKVATVKVPDTSEAVWLGLNMSLLDCELECKKNCTCYAYSSTSISGKEPGCLAWYGELMDTVINVEEGSDIYVRVDALELAEITQKSNGFLEKKHLLAIFLVSIFLAWFVIILFVYLWFKKKGKRVRNAKLLNTIKANEDRGGVSNPEIAFFNLNIILAATDNFSPANKLGQGGFGLVYKGQLSNGQEIAVKRLSKTSEQGIEEFKNEVLLIAKLQHQNLVKLIGCCIQREESILVYEYMPNKSLDSFIFDFGLARIFKGDQTQEKTNKIVGTLGYMSPEYAVFGKFSTKSDVFSFGIILLEIVTGKKNNSSCQGDSYLSMAGKVWHLWTEERALEIVDSSMQESCSAHEVLRCIQIGLLCVQEDALKRPSMSAVVVMLNSEISLPSPKQPPFIFRKPITSYNSAITKNEFYSVDEETITELVCR